jgi:outer membrane protein assembly factor BamB/tetratricopeptide (TPR) repeat protein
MARQLCTSNRSWTFGMALSIVLAVLTAAHAQQQVRLIFGGPAPQAELTAPQVNSIPGTAASRLQQARALAAAGNWDEALDIYNELAAGNSDRVVALDDGRCVSLRTYCQLQLARMPAEALAVYRRRVDPLAERWYRDGLAARDEQLLTRILDELFCSSWGDDALLALGELALERGDYDAARRYWEQISPLLRAPDGNSLWQAFHGVDLKANWPEIKRQWLARKNPPDWLAYPDSQLDLAHIRARLILTTIRSGQLDRAALELDVFRRLHPDSAGQLGGQQGPYVAALEKLLESAREWKPDPPSPDWPTFAGAQSRSPNAMAVGPTLVPGWERPVPLAPPPFARRTALIDVRAFGVRAPVEETPKVVVRESGRPLSCFPVVVDGVVLFANATGIHAANLATGKPAIVTDGWIFRSAPPEIQGNENPVRYGGTGIAYGVPRLTLNVVDHVAYGRIGPLATAHPERRPDISGDRIVGLDLNREGLLILRVPPGEPAWSFDGTPVSDGRRLFVAMRRSGTAPNAYVACFDTATSQRLWRTNIGSADTPAGSLGDEITHNLLTLVGDRIYLNTNLGLVAALDADSGEICWLAKYPRLTGKLFAPANAMPVHFDRDPSPAVYHDGLVIVAPADTPDILALDSDTGKTVWVNNQLADGLQLLGVVSQKLVVSGNRLAVVDVHTGKTEWIWPESSTAGIRGMGRGVIAGNEIFWPTRTEIYAFDPASGTRTRSPISLSPVSDCGANLAAAAGRLIVAGYDKLQCFGPPIPLNRPMSKPKQTDASASGG